VWTVAIGVVAAAIVFGSGLAAAMSHHGDAAASTAALGFAPRPAVDAPAPQPTGAAALVPMPSEISLGPALPDLRGLNSTSAPAPVRLVAAGWASASPTAGTVDDPTVPAGSLPVAARGGSIDKVSFLRFSGKPGPLRFGLAGGDALTQQDDATAAVQACTITT